MAALRLSSGQLDRLKSLSDYGLLTTFCFTNFFFILQIIAIILYGDVCTESNDIQF